MIRGPFDELSLGDACDAALRSGEGIEHAQRYLGWASGDRIGQEDSDNHGAQGRSADLVNWYNGKPTVEPPERIVAALRALFLDGAWREGFERGAYQRWMVALLRRAREILRAKGYTVEAARAGECLRAVLGWLACGAGWATCRLIAPDDLRRPGPGVVHAGTPLSEDAARAVVELEESPRPTGGTDLVRWRRTVDARVRDWLAELPQLPVHSACGPRSLNRKPRGTAGRDPGAGDPPAIFRDLAPSTLIAELIRDAALGVVDAEGRALASRGLDGRWMTPDDAAVCQRALRGEPAALATCAQWAMTWLPASPFRLIRWERAVAVYCLEGPALGGTQSLDGVVTYLATGEQDFLALATGDREHTGGADKVKPTHVVVSEDGREAVGQVDDGSLDAVELQITRDVGARVLDVEIGGLERRRIVRLIPGHVDPPPVTPPPTTTPPPRREPWWRRWWRRIFG